MESTRITLRQAFWLFVNSRFIITLVFIPQVSELLNNQDILPALVLNIPMDLLYVIVFLTLWLQYPNQTLIEYSRLIVGHWLGKGIGILYICYFILLACITLRIFNEFMTTRFLPNTPVEVIDLGILLIAAYSIYMGLEVLGRCAEVLVPIIFVGVILLVGLAVPNAHWRNVIPVWEHGITQMLIANTPTTTRWNDLAWMAMIMPFIVNNHKISRVVFGGIVFLRIIWFILMVPMVAIFGPDILKRLQFPTYELVEVITVGAFLERIDALVLGLWVFGAFLKIAILYYVIVLGVTQWFGLKNKKPLIYPIGLVIMILSMLLFSNIVELRNFEKSLVPINFIFVFAIPSILLTVHFVKKRIR